MWNGFLGNCPVCQFTPFHEPFSHKITIMFLANTSNYHYIFFCCGKWPANPLMFLSNINEATSVTNFCITPAPWCRAVGFSPCGAWIQTGSALGVCIWILIRNAQSPTVPSPPRTLQCTPEHCNGLRWWILCRQHTQLSKQTVSGEMKICLPK